MANITLLNDEVTYFLLVTRNQAGAIVPAAPGDVDSVTSASPSLVAAITVMPANAPAALVGLPALSLTPAVALSNSTNGGGGLAITLTDTNSLPMAQPYLFDIGPDVGPANIGLDLTNMVVTAQPIPTAPGP